MLVSDLLDLIERDYIMNGRSSFQSFVVYHWRHVERLLGSLTTTKLTAAKIEAYKVRRLEEGAARGSVNLQLALVRRGLRLAIRLGKIGKMPHVQLFSGQTVREGFLTVAQFRKVHATLEVLDPAVADLVEFLYATGWRASEAKGLRWSEITDEAIHLSRSRSKNRRPRTVPLAEPLKGIIGRRLALRSGSFVFHRRGRPIRSFRGVWRTALRARALEGLLVHDMRRSFCRNCLLAGVSQRAAMAIGGWTSNRTWARYCIVDEALLAEALAKIHAL